MRLKSNKLINQRQNMNLSGRLAYITSIKRDYSREIERGLFSTLHWQLRPAKHDLYRSYYSGWKWMSTLMGHHVSPYFGEWVVSVRALCSVNSSSCFLVDVFGILGAERSALCVVDFCRGGESNNRQTFHKHFSLLFGAFFNAMVICSMFDFY